jgi:O-antigen/teichoic acid export membrane protein
MQRRATTLTSDAAFLALGGIALPAGAILSLTVLARVIPKAELGGYQQLCLLYAIVAPLLLGGIPAALLYFIPRSEDDEERRRWVVESYLVLGAFGLLASAAVFLARGAIAEGLNNPGLSPAIALYSPYLFFAFVVAVMPNALIPAGHARGAAALNGIAGVLHAAALVVAGLIRPDAEALGLAASCSMGLLALASITVVVRRLSLRWPRRLRLARWRALLGYGVPLALTGLAAKLGYQFDRVVVTTHFDASHYAIYALGAVEIPVAIVLQQAVNSVLVPEMASRYAAGDRAGMVRLWKEAIRKSSLVLLPMFTFLAVTSSQLVYVLYGPRYGQVTEIFRIYLLLLPVRVATYGLITLAIGRTRINLAASILMLGSNAALALLLVGPLGLPGPAVATVVSTAAVVGFYLVRLRSILAIPVADLFPWRMLAGNMIGAVLATLPIVPIVLLDLPAVVTLAGAGIVFLVAYVGLMRATRRITDGDWTRMRRVAPLRRIQALAS